MMITRTLLFAVAALGALPALAAPRAADDANDRYAARAIVRGDLTSASETLWSSFGKGDRRPEILLNLAAVQVGRHDADDARALYGMVLKQESVDMITPVGPATSHEIAQRGLARLTR